MITQALNPKPYSKKFASISPTLRTPAMNATTGQNSVSLAVCMYACTHVCRYVYVYILYICICICIYVYVYINIYTHTHTLFYTYMYTRSCVCQQNPISSNPKQPKAHPWETRSNMGATKGFLAFRISEFWGPVPSLPYTLKALATKLCATRTPPQIQEPYNFSIHPS